MAIEVVMPRMGLTMEEGTVISWLKRVGEEVKQGEPLVEIETDKTTVEVESPGSGTLGRILAEPGSTVPVGETIGLLVAAGEQLPVRRELAAEKLSSAPLPSAPAPDRVAPQRDVGEKVRASPAARVLAAKAGIDLSTVSGTGPGGRIVAWNIATAGSGTGSVPQSGVVRVSPIAERMATELGVDLAQVRGTGPAGQIRKEDVARAASQLRGAEVVPLSRMQRLMAERMVASFTSAPHFYLHVEVNAGPLIGLQELLGKQIETATGVHLTVTDLLIKFCALTLAKHPRLLVQWHEGELRKASSIDIGLATDTPNGLIVPVIRRADSLAMAEIGRVRADLTSRARQGKLRLEELEQGAFTLTNLGMFGIDSFDAILNPPQAAILAVGRIRPRPWVQGGVVLAAPSLTLSLSVDHRVVDGATGARFLGELVHLIENPGLVLA